jgi:hypothetical protein
MTTARDYRLACSVRDACLDAALAAYESAGLSGLCGEGRWEMAVQALRALDLEAVLAGMARAEDSDAQDAV